MLRFHYFAFLFLLPVVCGCGVTFGDVKTNLPIPEGFRARSVYPSGVAAYTFEDLVGAILVLEEGKDPVRLGLILPPKYPVEVQVIEKPLHSYESRITSGASAQGGYLAFAADMKTDTIVHIKLADAAKAGISYTQDPNAWPSIEEQLIKWVKEHPKKGNETRIWIKELVLVSKSFNTYSKISSNASGQVGSVTGVEGGVYATYDKDDLTSIITFESVDIDRVVGLLKPNDDKSLLPLTPQALFNKARFAQEIKGTIRLNP